MPQLIGMPLERARAILDSLNLGISEITRVKDTLYLPQTVLDQIPTRNAPLMKGDMVRLTVSKTD
jgi:beta-lactam-binding protein with PASTA domain